MGTNTCHAPGVLASEALYVLCGKLQNGVLTPAAHAQAITDLENFLSGIFPPPNGEAPLVRRAEAIRGSYVCNRSADSLYTLDSRAQSRQSSPRWIPTGALRSLCVKRG